MVTCKRVLSVCVCVLMLLGGMTLACTAAESMDTLSKIYTLRLSESAPRIDMEPTSPAFWEYPVLHAGEDYVEGTMVLKNDSASSVSVRLKSVTLPYGDNAKLSYLNHLLITVKEGDTVLYDGTYAHINDPEGGLKIDIKDMPSQSEHIYTIKMRCLYSYAGSPQADVSQLTWNFFASEEHTVMQGGEGLPKGVDIVLCVLGGTMIALILVVIVRAIVRGVKKSKARRENEEKNS